MHNLTLGDLIAALESRGLVDAAQHARLAFWREQLGRMPITNITADHVEDAVTGLANRGRLKAGRNSPGVPSGKPLKPSTISRYIGTLQGVYKFARQERLIRRDFASPTKGVEKPSAPVDKNKFLTPEEVELLLKWSRVLDQRWGRMSALILMCYHTGLRVGSLKNVRWCDIDWERETVYIPKTKNGDPITSPLTSKCLGELRRLRKGAPEELVFGNRHGEPFHHRNLLAKITRKAGLPHVTIHWLRHSCGTAMAQAGLSQAQIMAQLGHKTLAASQRYMHSNAEFQRQALERVSAFQ
jgi:integrase